MKTVTFNKESQWALGVKTDKGILDVEAALQAIQSTGNFPKTTNELLSNGEDALHKLSTLVEEAHSVDSLFYKEDSLIFGPCVPEPQKIICVGLNYKKTCR